MKAEELIKAKEDSVSVAYQTFILLTSNLLTGNPLDTLFCFFEGNDAPYYHIRIKSHFKGKPHYITCGGKKNVKKICQLIKQHSEYRIYRKAFFIDRDFDKSIKNRYKEIYETPTYSIENFYCSEQAISELLKTNFQLTENSNEYNNIMRTYRELMMKFLNDSLLFNAWYKIQKRKCEKEKIPNNVSLSDSLIPEFIKVGLDSVNQEYDLDKILSKYPNSLPVSPKEIERSIKSFKKSNLILDLRGKYIFHFLLYFLRLLIADGGDKTKRTLVKRKIKYGIDNSNALTLLTSYADTPQCLVDFIQRYN